MESGGISAAGNSAVGVPGETDQRAIEERNIRPSNSPSSPGTTDTVLDFANEKSERQNDARRSQDSDVRYRPSKWRPNYFLFTRYIDRDIGTLYAVGTASALLAGLAFPSLDLLYGNFTSANTSGSSGFNGEQAAEATEAARVVGLGILGVGIGELIFTWLFLVCFTRAGEKMGRKIRNAYLASVMRQDIVFFDNVGAGEVAGRTTKDIALIQGGIGEKLAFAIWCFTTILVGTIIGFIKAARMAGVLFALIPFTLFLYWITVHYGNKFTEEEMEAEGKAGSFLDQILGSIRIVQAFSAENALAVRYNEYLGRVQKAGEKKATIRGAELSVLFFCVLTSFALSFWWGSELISVAGGPGIGLGPLTTTFFVFLSGLFSIAGIVPQISTITESAQVQARIFRDIDRIPEIDSTLSSGYTGDIDPSVQLSDVTFMYPSRPTQKSLDNVSLHFEANKTTAIVGSSGSGKSTVTSLLLRFYDPQEGSVRLGKTEIRDFNVKHLRRNVAMCSQNPTMFNMSVFDNIAAGMTGVAHLAHLSEEERKEAVIEAARAADALQFIEKLPKGFDTIVGASGAFLSGGQRQRVAIARALIRDPRVLILDEATSALDSSSEKRVYAALNKKRGERTMIIIAHRISSIKNADKIVVMGNGRVLEEGTHDELLEKKAAYRELVDKTNANNQIPGMNDDDEEAHKLPSEKHWARPIQAARSTTYDSKSAPVGASHGSYMTHVGAREALVPSEPKTERQLLRVPTNIEANPAGLIEPDDEDEMKRKYSGISLMSRFGKYVADQWHWMLLGLFASACLGATFPSSAYLVGSTVDQLSILTEGDESARGTVHNHAMWFQIIAITAIFTGFSSGFFFCFASERLVRKFRYTLCRVLLRQEVGFFDDDDNSVGTLTSGLSSHPAAVAAASGLVISQLLISTFNLLGSIALAYSQNWKLAVVCLAPVLLFVIFAYFNVVLLEKYENEGQGARDSSASYASDNIGAIREVQAMTREDAVHDHYANLLHPDNDKARLKYLYMGVFGFAISQATVFWISGLTFWWGSELLTSNQISATAFYSTFEAVIIASFSTGRASSFIPDISRAFHSMKIISRYLDRVPKFQTIGASTANLHSTEKPTQGLEIVFKGVGLRYPSRPDVKVLEHFDLRIEAGQHIAFCGHSGGGKTSTLSLLQRYYDPIEGSISFDGQDIRKLSLADHRARMSLVSQDAILYEGTVAWNLSLGALDPESVTHDDLVRACEAANILDFVEGLPSGFETPIGIKGGQLSGGQKQRLCIARALIRNPQILLLDEATSALDATAERSVQKALDKASEGRTTITIAHRLSTIANADVIYVVQDGKIVEGGTHRDLLERGGRYKELIQAQLD